MILLNSVTNIIRGRITFEIWNDLEDLLDHLVFYMLRNSLSYQVQISVWNEIWIQLYSLL